LYYSYIKVIVDAIVPSEDGIVKKWAFKRGSVERSIRYVPKRVYLSRCRQVIFSISATNKK
jgi:hypothetical protein